jgi:hypothetical protein
MVPNDATLELSREEIVARIDREARRRLGMSAEELLQAYREGRLKDCGTVADLLSLANLLDPADPLFAAA